MSLGKGIFLLVVSIAGFLSLAIVEQRHWLYEHEAKAALVRTELTASRGVIQTLRAQLANAMQTAAEAQALRAVGERNLATAHEEIEQLKEKLASQTGQQGELTEQRERAAVTDRVLIEVQEKLAILMRDLDHAREENEVLKEQSRTNIALSRAVRVDEGSAADQGRALTEEREKAAALADDLALAREKLAQSKEQSAAAVEEADKRALQQVTALTRDLRAARKELHRLKQATRAPGILDSTSEAERNNNQLPDTERRSLGVRNSAPRGQAAELRLDQEGQRAVARE